MKRTTEAATTGGVHPRNIISEYLWWLIVFVILIVIAFGIKNHYESKEKEEITETAQAITGTGCTKNRPCSLQRQADGSTEKVSLPEGKQVCFDASFWDNIDQLGYMTSYKGGPEKKYMCTREQVLDGACHERTGDTFRFNPKKRSANS